MEKINEDLFFNYIEDNRICEETQKPITVLMSFAFFGKHYDAYLKVDSIDIGKLRYPMVEGPGKLLEAFEDELESEEVTQFIIKKVKDHILEYHSEDDLDLEDCPNCGSDAVGLDGTDVVTLLECFHCDHNWIP